MCSLIDIPIEFLIVIVSHQNIPSRFLEHREEVTFEQVNKGSGLSMHSGSVSLSLAEGCMHEVFVSSIVGGGEFVGAADYSSYC